MSRCWGPSVDASDRAKSEYLAASPAAGASLGGTWTLQFKRKQRAQALRSHWSSLPGDDPGSFEDFAARQERLDDAGG
jgi:hypothetical protein